MKFAAAALVAAVSANTYDFMGEDDLLAQLSSNLSQAQQLESRGDADAAVAKTAAIKNIQKAFTARILKRLDDGQPLVEVARKMKAIEGMQPQINDMERRLGIMQSVEPVLDNAIKTLQKVVDVRGMGKKLIEEKEEEATQYDSMTEDELLVNLESTLSSAQRNEARGDGDAAVAKTAAIKNIQKALTARILKRLDDGQPLVEVARKMNAIEGMQP